MRFLLLLALFASIIAFGGKQTFTGVLGLHQYELFVPADLKKPAPLFVFIHGCKETAEEFLGLTRVLSLAKKHGFIVLAPHQNILLNPDRCWNWWYAGNQTRTPFFETGTIIGMVNAVKLAYPVDRRRVFAVGLSSGAVTAANLAACWPDVFSGVAIHSGMAHRITTGSGDAEQTLTEPPKLGADELGHLAYTCASLNEEDVLLKTVLVIHGKHDTRVVPSHAQAIFSQMKVMFDWVDDRNPNQSIKWVEKSQTVTPVGKLGYDSSRLEGPRGLRLEKILIENMSHAWAGGDPAFPFAESKAIHITEKIVKDFLQ